MPLLGLGKQWLHPHLPLADRLLVGLRGMVASHLLEVVDVEGPLHLAAVVAGRALGLDRTGIADRRLAPIGDNFLGALDCVAAKRAPLRAAVLVALRIAGEVVLVVEVPP